MWTTIIEARNLDELRTKTPSVDIIPAGSPVDITIDISVWELIARGVTMSLLAQNEQWAANLERSGIRVDSIDSAWNSTSLTIHGTAINDVLVNDVSISGVSTAEAGSGQALTWGILAVIGILGITAGVTYFKVSSDLRARQETNVTLVKDLISKGYTSDQINAILKNVNAIQPPSLPGLDGLGIPGWAIPVGIAVAAALILLPSFRR